MVWYQVAQAALQQTLPEVDTAAAASAAAAALVSAPEQRGLSVASAGTLLDVAAAALRHAPLLLLVMLHFYGLGASAAPTGTGSGDAADIPGGSDSGDGQGTSSSSSAGSESSSASSSASSSSPGDKLPCSKGLGFNESLGVRDRAYQDLIACDEHHGRTCCTRDESVKIRGLWATFAADGSQRCSRMARAALCAACDGDVGVGLKSAKNVIFLCPSLCQRWYEACSEDFFAPAPQGLQPCGPNAPVCSPLSEITSSARDFCSTIVGPLGAMFAVSSEDQEPEGCFDGVPTVRSKGRGPKAPRPPRRETSSDLMKLLQAFFAHWGDPDYTVYFLAVNAVIVILFGWCIFSFSKEDKPKEPAIDSESDDEDDDDGGRRG